MKKYLISIVSQQTLPNYLLIKEFFDEIDTFFFISSSQMEEKGKTNDLVDTARIPKVKKREITIDENEFYLAHQRLDRVNFPQDAEYLVNLTGGTKMMAIAVREYFEKFPHSRFFYVPMDKNIYKEIHNDRPASIKEFSYRVGVDEYLSIYGMKGESAKLFLTETQALEIYKDVRSARYDLENFPVKKLKKFVPYWEITDQLKTKWFEEYLYYRIKGILNLQERFIATGLKLYSKNQKQNEQLPDYAHQNDNEVDLFLMYDNKPYSVELKFSIGKENINIDTLNNALFKLSAVNRRFGLNIYSTIMTLSDLHSLDEQARWHLKRRCHILGLHYPLDRHDIHERFPEKLSDFLQKKMPTEV